MSAAVVATLAAARDGGFVLTVEDGALRCRPALVPPELLNKLRANKNELLQVLTGDRCRRCGERMAWPAPRGVVYADGSAEHHEYHVWAAADRALRSPDALADEAEIFIRGGLAPIDNRESCRQVRPLDELGRCAECADDTTNHDKRTTI